MYVLFNHTDLVGKGILSIFVAKKFTLKIGTCPTTELILTSTYNHMGIIREIVTDKFYMEVYDKEVLIERIDVSIKNIYFIYDKNEKSYVKFDNSLFSGKIFLYKMMYDGFTDLENLFLTDKTTYLTKKTEEGRITYYGKKYNVDNSLMFIQNNREESLPFGWEKRIHNGVIIYIDHNTKTITNSCIYPRKLQDVYISTFFNEKLVVDRNDILRSSMNAIFDKSVTLKTSELKIVFLDEIGDGIGLKREYFRLIGIELAKDKRLTNKNGFYDLSRERDWNNEEDRKFLLFLGIIIGTSIINHCTLNIKFSLLFLESISNKKFDVSKIQDTSIQRSLLKVLRNEISFDEALNLFCLQKNELVGIKGNKELVSYLIQQMYYNDLIEQYVIVQNVFKSYVPQSFSSHELFYYLNIPELTVEELFKNVSYVACRAFTKEIRFLKEILADDYLRQRFIIFVTGELSFNPEPPLTIEMINIHNLYFLATTCNRAVRIGKYNTKTDMERICRESVANLEFHIV